MTSSNSKTMAKQSVTIYINDSYQYFVNENKVSELQLQDQIDNRIAGQIDASVVLRSDKSVPVQYVVNVIDAVNNINKKYNTKHKVILATQPKR